MTTAQQLVLYWKPSEPAATLPAIDFLVDPQSGSAYATTTFQNELAVTAPNTDAAYDGGYYYAQISSDQFTIGTGNFTFEGWAKPGAITGERFAFFELFTSTGYISLGFYDVGDGFGSDCYIDGASYSATSNTVLLSDPGWRHFSVQRINGLYYFHYQGQPVALTVDPILDGPDTDDFIDSSLYISAYVYTDAAPAPAISQTRVTKAAIYAAERSIL
jgi:hypothetical protein